MALDIVRAELTRLGDMASLQTIDELLQRLSSEEDNDDKDQFDKFIYKLVGPRTLIEELCYIGLKQGVNDSKKTNLLKLAQTVMDTRMSLALESCKLIAAQNNFARQYYKMIKDAGGFTSFKFSKKAQVFFVENNDKYLKEKENRKIEAEHKAKALTEKLAAAAAEAQNAANQSKKVSVAPVEANLSSGTVKGEKKAGEEKEEDPSFLFDDGFMGPIMM